MIVAPIIAASVVVGLLVLGLAAIRMLPKLGEAFGEARRRAHVLCVEGEHVAAARLREAAELLGDDGFRLRRLLSRNSRRPISLRPTPTAGTPLARRPGRAA